jgi:iron complex transport system ATP-binding protein
LVFNHFGVLGDPNRQRGGCGHGAFSSKFSTGYGQQAIIEAVNLSVEQQEWLCLVGANGSGKSTLLKGISRILPPQAGVVYLNGREVHQLPTQEVARQMAILPQQQTLPAALSVYQLVSLGRSPHQTWWQWELDAEGRHQVEQALAWTELTTHRDRPIAELSGGERQRAFLALALAQNPQVLLLDEPTTFLDIHYQLQLLDLLKRLNQQQQFSIITVLHDVNLAARYCDRIALLRQGKLWAVGSPPQVLTPQLMREVFEVEVCLLQTPVGLQVCPMGANQNPFIAIE